MPEPLPAHAEAHRLARKLTDVSDNLGVKFLNGASWEIIAADLNCAYELLEELRKLNDKPRLGVLGRRS